MLRVCVLYSGGKDSTLALMRAAEEHRVVCLATLLPGSAENPLFHYPNSHLTELQARAMDLPLVSARCPDSEAGALSALGKVLARAKEAYGAEAVVTGAVKSRYQLERFARVCRSLGLEVLSPLWGLDEEELLREVLRAGIKAVITRVAGYPLSPSLLGKQLDEGLVERLVSLRGYVNPSGEGGEYETLVLDAPVFRRAVVPLEWRVEQAGEYEATLHVIRAMLAPKAGGDLGVRRNFYPSPRHP